jgi:hypothetical protein
MHHRNKFLLMAFLACAVFFFVKCMNNGKASTDPRGSLYAGSASCAGCHKDIVAAFAANNHARSSAKTSPAILERFVNGHNNTAYYADSSLVRVHKAHDAFVQSYLQNGQELRSAAMDIAIGSAEKAQTYAYWKGDQLFQLPLTYFAAGSVWTNSPGFPMQTPYFDRVVLSRCFECHASYVEKTDVPSGNFEVSERINASSMVLGIDCERCHGPAAEHVQFHQDNPAVKQARFITSIKTLPRQRQLDLCSVCHSGNDLDVQRTLFAFRPGDTLDNFFYPHFGAGKPNPDVHGKQLQLLMQSKCFQASQMTCGTCHSPHKQQNINTIVTQCMHCHQASQHAVTYQTQATACINCHMPLQESKVLDFNDGKQRKSIPYMLRTHRIAVYGK